ncbi:nucleoporin 88-like isoform X2 [Ylistrum balloti]|uniref:nucleoporin 88-like isoform X2 n=1 Tax=Ylistrum balloti TaxID=509963 RepID=UPI00290580D3|nr:nucleoporin 88-like isoform X2 [Ylistrum balloti]
MAGVDNWRTCLNDQPFCKQLRENNAKDSGQKRYSTSKGLTAIQGGDLYVWDSFSCHLVFYNLKNLLPECADRERNQAQILLCSNAPRFEVEFLTFNLTGSLVALWGKGGITVLELPKRWGRYAELEGGKPSISCKSISIASHFFASHKGAGLQQVLWHPGSESDTHMAFLTSNGILSVYNIQFPDVPVQVIHVDSQEPSQSASCISVATALGEKTMGFDFGPPIQLSRRASFSLSSQMDSTTVWPAYVVKGNGDMLVAYTDLLSSSPVKLAPQGPLLMHPPAEDNYGVDACSVCCLGETPTVLVIATCEGKLHHCVVLPSNSPESQTDSDWSASAGSSSQFEGAPDVSLYVYESVELELTLTTAANEAEDEFTCPIRLHKDGTDLKDLPEQQECIVEHLICTKPLLSSPPSPVLGVGVVREASLGTFLLVLTSDIHFVSLPLSTSTKYKLSTPVMGTSPRLIQSPLRSLAQEPFHQHIAKILARKSTNPVLKSAKAASMSSQECFQLLSRTTQVFREEYLQKQGLAQQEIQKRVRILTQLKQQQQQDLRDLDNSRARLHESAQELAIRYEDCQEEHETILRRIEAVMRRLQARNPVLSEAERGMKKDLEAMEEQLDNYKRSLHQLRTKHDYQTRQIKKSEVAAASHSLKNSQVSQVRSVLQQEGEDLSNMLHRINQLKLDVGV